MGIIKIRANKPTQDSKMGIKYLSDGVGMTITGIFENSIFESTNLKVGHEVIRINDSSVYGKPMEWIRLKLASIEGEVELDVKVNEDTKNYIQIRATKPSPDSKLGIRYVPGETSVVITGIMEDSIFSSTALKVGHEIFLINGTPVAGNGRDWVASMLYSIPDTIVFDVKNTWTAGVKLISVGKKAPTGNTRVGSSDDRVRILLRCVLDASRSEPPLFFVGHGIPIDEWERIYDIIEGDLVPAIAESRLIDDVMRKEMGVYRSKQIVKGYMDIGESQHEAKVFKMTQSASAMADTCTLVATNVLSHVSSIMAPYSVRCEIDLESYELPKYSDIKQKQAFQAKRVNGIKFIPIVQRTIPDATTVPPLAVAELAL
ncbi:unnamed protein product [Cylindrotheca closterium]|uniref:PDZ domain-containing protein n=1 Tax=Cylindrotheca closterium TaxID=2856 RepID=A0AAD2CBJ8_9STRA|nr:unnamed protein product [Cylindrotheca closterium]